MSNYEWALPKGTILHGGLYPYEVIECLGHGGFGITYKVKTSLKAGNINVTTHFALKEYFPTGCWRGDDGTTMLYSRALDADMKSGLKDFITEGNRLQKICNVNPHIVNVNEVFEANGTAYFVMEYLSGGDLRQMVKNNGGPLSEAAMMSILNPIASAIDAVHQNHILHLDIKPENIVMRLGDDGNPDVPVLIDFGIAVHFDNRGNPTTTRPTKGMSPGYSPSEQYAGVKRFDPRLDIYALSATCYYMITGKDPLDAFEVDANDLITELTPLVSKRTRDAIVHGMARMANQRPLSIAQFLKSFEEINAMPIGSVIHGSACNYMIMAVLDETPSYVHYKASLYTGEERRRDANSTRDLNVRNTSRKLYDLYEQLLDGKRINGGDGIPWDLPELRKARFQPRAFGVQTAKTGSVASEYFIVDGVQYLSLCEGYKTPPRERKPRKEKPPKEPKEREPLWPKLKRPLLITAAAIAIVAVAALAMWGIAKLLSSKPHSDDRSIVSDEQSREMVNDSVPGEAVSNEAPFVAPNQPQQAPPPTTKQENKPDEKKETTEKPKETKKETPKEEETPPKPKDTRSLDEQAQDAAQRRDFNEVKRLARQGSETARVICDNRGIDWK